jgi:hypothetical protein
MGWFYSIGGKIGMDFSTRPHMQKAPQRFRDGALQDDISAICQGSEKLNL